MWHRLEKAISRYRRPEVYAIAIDLYRVIGGAFILAYFVRLLLEFPTFTVRDGLLDHELLGRVFWFSAVSLFGPWMPEWLMFSLLFSGLFSALALTLGRAPRLNALWCLILAVSLSRWNFALITVDDAGPHLVMFWLFLLPTGTTLVPGRFRGWKEEVSLKVPGLVVRLFYANLFIYYLTAGLTKLWSPLWREGYALYAILRLPLARSSSWWGLEHLELTWLFNHLTLILEPILPFIILLRRGHPVRYLGAITWIVFHLGIIFTIGVPYANLGLVIALILVFQEKIGHFLTRHHGVPDQSEDPEPPTPSPQLAWNELFALVFLMILSLAMSKGIPVIEKVYEPCMASLYVMGSAQEYHLFDWIDRFNFYVDYDIKRIEEDGTEHQMEMSDLFPPNIRGFILQSYLSL